jgi:pyruvate/2-oxoglutarate dehydrogenase complex dihydrolipoamide acyltransferase (E2) component
MDAFVWRGGGLPSANRRTARGVIMPIQVLMPALSLNTAESKITRWEKKEGDKVSKGDIICEVESDKATMEVEAAGEGILHILVQEGDDIVPVNTPVALLIDEGDMPEIPPEVKAFLEGILKDSGMTIDKEMQSEMIKELFQRLDAFIVDQLLDHMPKKYLDTFIKMNEQKRPKAELERFVQEHVPNAGKVFTNAFAEFRKLYGGKGA